MTAPRTRRQLLIEALTLPLISRGAPWVPAIGNEEDCLAEESARGFRAVLQTPEIVVLPAVRQMRLNRALALRERVEKGAWLIWESAGYFAREQQSFAERSLLRQVFGIRVTEPIAAKDLYVRYHWPVQTLTRSFVGVTPVECRASDLIANAGGRAVALRKPLGAGGVLFLGSLLGPALAAGDPQARQIALGIAKLCSQ